MDKRFSILYQLDYCAICGKPYPQLHEIFYGRKNRELSKKYGLIIPLCFEHHNKDRKSGSIHFNPEFDLDEKQNAQRKAMKHYGWSMEDWMKIFRENYL